MENRFLFGGIDTDSAPHAIDDGMLMNCVNARSIVSETQNSTDLQFIDGNSEKAIVQAILPAGVNTLLGKCVDQENQKIYLFFHNVNDDHCIIQYIVSSATASIILDNSWVTQGLDWSADTFIDAGIAGDLLFWCATGQEPMVLNLGFSYSGSQPFDISLIKLVNEPPVVPLVCERVSNTPVYGDIQFEPIQFTYRITTVDNSTSVLAPYSLTQLPVRESEIISNADAGNSVDIEVDLDQKFPANWKIIEFLVRFVNGNTFFVIKEYHSDVSADVTAINNHNSGSAALAFTWMGDTLYAIDQASAAKLFDNVPLTSKALELADSRLFLANNTEGYDTPNTPPGYSVATNTYNTDDPTANTVQAYVLACMKANFDWYFAVCIRYNNKNYLLPKDCATGQFAHNGSGSSQLEDTCTLTLFDELWTIPSRVCVDDLTELSETAAFSTTLGHLGQDWVVYNLVSEANEADFSDSFDQAWVLEYNEFSLVETPDEFGSSGESRACMPNASYKFGIQYYDKALRKCGVLPLATETIPLYGPWSRELTENIEVTLDNTVAPPDWAHYYSVTFSKEQKAQRIIQFVPSLIKVALKATDGSVRLSGYQNLVSVSPGYIVYGLAIPITNLIKYGYGYEYTAGDYVELVGIAPGGLDDTSVIRGTVLAVENGYLIMSYDSSKLAELDRIVPESSKYLFQSGDPAPGPPSATKFQSTYVTDLIKRFVDPLAPDYAEEDDLLVMRQSTVVCTIYNGVPADSELYEVALFGPINNPGSSPTFGNFYESGSLTATFMGDHYTQKRSSDCGALTCVSITTYDPQNQFPVNDTGRIAQVDRVGAQALPTMIRWSNTNIPGTNSNGYFTFDALDYKILEESAGEITSLAFTTKGVQEGGQMLILCSNGSFTTLVGKQQVYGSDQNSAFVLSSASQVLGDVNPLKGSWACISPRSVVVYQGKVWWVDYNNRDIIEFGDGGANPVSQYKANRLWNKILSILPSTKADKVTAAVNPYCAEYLISIPDLGTSKDGLPSTNIHDPFDAFFGDNRTYIYNWELNKWIGSFQSGAEMVNVHDRVFSFKNVQDPSVDYIKVQPKFAEEFTGNPSEWYGVPYDAIIGVPFNADYPKVKSPLSVVLSCNRPPDQCWIKTDAQKFGVQVAQSGEWREFEGDMQADILRNRLSNNASTNSEYDLSGIEGDRLKGKTVLVAFLFNPSEGEFFASSAGINYQESSGH